MTTTNNSLNSEYSKTVSLYDAFDAMVQLDETNFADTDPEISEITLGRIQFLASIFKMTAFDVEDKLREMTLDANEIARGEDEIFAKCLKDGENAVRGS